MDDFRRKERVGGGQVDASAGQVDHGQHGAPHLRGHVVDGLGIRVIVEYRAVFIPTQTANCDHGWHKFIGIRPVALGIDQARRNVQAGSAGFPQIPFVQQGIRTEPLTGKPEHFAVGEGRGGVAVFKSPFGTPSGFRIVKLDPLHAVLAQSGPDLGHVLLEIRIGIIKAHQRLLVRVPDLQSADIVGQHMAREGNCVIIGGHTDLEIGVRNAITLADGGAPFGHRVVRRHEVFIFHPVLVIPPALLRI